MERIGPVGDAAIARVLARAPLTPEKVTFAWRLAVGPAIARASTVELRDARLIVRVADPAWAREIARADGVILSRLRRVLGADTVGSLELPTRAHDRTPAGPRTSPTRHRTTSARRRSNP